jgi:hypothetical protein
MKPSPSLGRIFSSYEIDSPAPSQPSPTTKPYDKIIPSLSSQGKASMTTRARIALCLLGMGFFLPSAVRADDKSDLIVQIQKYVDTCQPGNPAAAPPPPPPYCDNKVAELHSQALHLGMHHDDVINALPKNRGPGIIWPHP